MNTLNYMIAGFGVILVLLTAYVVSLVRLRKKLKRQKEALTHKEQHPS